MRRTATRLTVRQLNDYAATMGRWPWWDRVAPTPTISTATPRGDWLAHGRAWREEEFQYHVRAMADTCGWLTYAVWSSIHSPAGYPDLTLIRGTRVIWAELKTDRGMVSSAQLIFMDALSTAEKEVYLWRPDDWFSGTIERILA